MQRFYVIAGKSNRDKEEVLFPSFHQTLNSFVRLWSEPWQWTNLQMNIFSLSKIYARFYGKSKYVHSAFALYKRDSFKYGSCDRNSTKYWVSIFMSRKLIFQYIVNFVKNSFNSIYLIPAYLVGISYCGKSGRLNKPNC